MKFQERLLDIVIFFIVVVLIAGVIFLIVFK
jgi:hypothetical protein